MIDEGTEKALQATPVRWTVQKDGLVSEDSLVVSTTSEYASQRGQRDWEALEKNSFDFLFSRAEAILEMKALPGDVRANCLSLA